MENEVYKLPELPYQYNALAPHISEKQLTIHHQKHHQAYVNGANALAQALAAARQNNAGYDAKAVAKELSFQLSGHILHSLFWQNLRPNPKSEKNDPGNKLLQMINRQFKSFDRFRQEFSLLASSAEGSGWAALAIDSRTKKLILLQIEKHNVNLIPEAKILLVLDVFEHAYYLDYQNDRAKFIAAFWHLVDWGEANRRLNAALL